VCFCLICVRPGPARYGLLSMTKSSGAAFIVQLWWATAVGLLNNIPYRKAYTMHPNLVSQAAGSLSGLLPCCPTSSAPSHNASNTWGSLSKQATTCITGCPESAHVPPSPYPQRYPYLPTIRATIRIEMNIADSAPTCKTGWPGSARVPLSPCPR